MLKKVWGIIFIVLGVASFLLGGYKYYQVENFSNVAGAMGLTGQSNGYFDNLVQSAYQESYMFLGIGILLSVVGSLMVKTIDKKKESSD